MLKTWLIVLVLWCFRSCYEYRVTCYVPLPPEAIKTRGAVWPKPVTHLHNNSYLALRPSHFSFKIERSDCDIIQEAVRRYYYIIFGNANNNQNYDNVDLFYDKHRSPEKKFLGFLDTLHIHLKNPCETYPTEYVDERYELLISADGFENTGLLVAQSVWGILRGLETFSQIVVPISGTKFGVHVTSIVDFPRYSHRGLLIDTSRHYLPVKTILRILDAMSYSKMNVLHWHIVDDQSFPFQSVSFPSLSNEGSFDPYLAIYTHSDVKRVVDHARLRGIRVIPEFDTPGHTLSWGKGLPGLLTKCSTAHTGPYGPVDPTREQNYQHLETLIREVFDLFPDSYIHLGGDEVDFDCWESNENIRNFMRRLGIKTYTELESYYISKLLNITQRINAKALVWQEVFDNNVPMDKETIVHVWKPGMEQELARITQHGHKAILSTCWYLDHVDSGGDWHKYYDSCSPNSFSGSSVQKRLVIGGEACMWGEVVDETNIQQRIWPRACATAEILWSGYPSSDAHNRLEEHVCRLKKRGISAQPPTGPGYCPYYTS